MLMALFKTTLPAVAVAGGLTAAILGLGAALASAEPAPPPPAPVQGEQPPGWAPAEARRVLGWAARGVELGLGRTLGRVDQRRLHHAVVKPCHQWRLITESQ